MSRSTLSPFDVAIAQADKVISDVMMSVYVINGKKYKAVLDEEPRVMGGGDDYLINGTTRTLALFKSSGYKLKPRTTYLALDAVITSPSFGFEDGKIVLQLE